MRRLVAGGLLLNWRSGGADPKGSLASPDGEGEGNELGCRSTKLGSGAEAHHLIRDTITDGAAQRAPRKNQDCICLDGILSGAVPFSHCENSGGRAGVANGSKSSMPQRFLSVCTRMHGPMG
jgi:hypothetical protein